MKKMHIRIKACFQFFPAFLLLSLTSCATLFNKSVTRVDVHTKAPAGIVVNQTDTIRTKDNNASFLVERSCNPLVVESITDSVSKTIIIPSRLSTTFWSNFWVFYGIPGGLIDLGSEKRFTYPENIFINNKNIRSGYSLIGNYNHKGEMYFNFSIPEINSLLQFTNYRGYVDNSGYMGISAGLDYFYSPKKFVNIMGSINLTNETGIPLPLEYFGPYENANSSYMSISNNHQFYFLSVGYGLSFSKNVWCYYNYGFDQWSNPYEIIKKNYSVGLVFPVYLKLAPHFHLGFIYRPGFYRPGSSQPFRYEHLLSVDFAWKFRVKK